MEVLAQYCLSAAAVETVIALYMRYIRDQGASTRRGGQTHGNANIRDDAVSDGKVLYVLPNLYHLSNGFVAGDELSDAHIVSIPIPSRRLKRADLPETWQ